MIHDIAAISVTPSWQLISIIRGRNGLSGYVAASSGFSLEISSQFSTSLSTLVV
jgi:hypothetical protein